MAVLFSLELKDGTLTHRNAVVVGEVVGKWRSAAACSILHKERCRSQAFWS